MIVNNPVYSTIVLDNQGRIWHRHIYTIGAWNMDTTQNYSITHGVASPLHKMISVESIWIYPDAGDTMYPLCNLHDAADPDLLAGGIASITDTVIGLYRRTGGWFDSIVFDDGVMDRGHAVVWIPES